MGVNMKKLFIIQLNEDQPLEHDQFDGLIIRAGNKDIAWQIAEKTVKSAPYYYTNYFTKDSFSIKEISNDGEDEVILASYNAG
jgi:hypothetical protein